MKKALLGLSLLSIFFQDVISQSSDNSLHFDTNDYVALNTIAQDVNNLSEFTIEFWVTFDAQLNTDYNVFYGVNTSNYNNRFLIRCAGEIDGVSDAAVVYINDGSNQYIVGSTPIGDNKCHHIAFTYDNGVCLLYVDGRLDASGYYTFAFQETDLHSLGQEYDMTPTPTSSFYNGELDDFRIWNIAKQQADIANNKNIELNGNEVGLLAYFNFNQGVASGNNTSISKLDNLAQPSQHGILLGFNLNETSTSNFITGTCLSPLVNTTESEILSSEINIFPNPTDGILRLTNTEHISSIIIRNNLGQVVFQSKSSSLIDIRSLPATSYFIEVSTNDNRKQVMKMLKQ